MLGHASISTTAQYVKQDETTKIKAAKLIFPDGI
jgi:site-specific recombinase XerD